MIQLFRRSNQSGNRRQKGKNLKHPVTQPNMIQRHRKASRSGIQIHLLIIVAAPVLPDIPEPIIILFLITVILIIGLKLLLTQITIFPMGTNDLIALSVNATRITAHLLDHLTTPVNWTTIIAPPTEIVIL